MNFLPKIHGQKSGCPNLVVLVYFSFNSIFLILLSAVPAVLHSKGLFPGCMRHYFYEMLGCLVFLDLGLMNQYDNNHKL